MKKTWFVMREGASETNMWTASVAGYWLYNEEPPAVEGQPRRVVWATPDEKNIIQYINDSVIGLQYILFEGDDIEPHLKVLTRLGGGEMPSEVLERVKSASTPAEHFRAVREAAIAAPTQFDRRFFEVICKGLAHSDPPIRRTSLLAFGYLGWREFEPLLERLMQSDPDADVRAEARIALDAARQHGWKGKG